MLWCMNQYSNTLYYFSSCHGRTLPLHFFHSVLFTVKDELKLLKVFCWEAAQQNVCMKSYGFIHVPRFWFLVMSGKSQLDLSVDGLTRHIITWISHLSWKISTREYAKQIVLIELLRVVLVMWWEIASIRNITLTLKAKHFLHIQCEHTGMQKSIGYNTDLSPTLQIPWALCGILASLTWFCFMVHKFYSLQPFSLPQQTSIFRGNDDPSVCYFLAGGKS